MPISSSYLCELIIWLRLHLGGLGGRLERRPDLRLPLEGGRSVPELVSFGLELPLRQRHVRLPSDLFVSQRPILEGGWENFGRRTQEKT